MGVNWRGKKDVTFPSVRRVLLWHAGKGLLLSTLCSAGPEWEFDFEFGALFSSLLLPNKLKLVSDPSPNQCGRNCAIKKIGENVQMFKRKWNKLITQHEDTFKNHGPILIFWREMWSMWLNLVFSKFLTTVISSDSSNWLLNFLLTTFCCFWNWLQFTAHLLLRFTKVVHLW